jgi:hypothetical protein
MLGENLGSVLQGKVFEIQGKNYPSNGEESKAVFYQISYITSTCHKILRS